MKVSRKRLQKKPSVARLFTKTAWLKLGSRRTRYTLVALAAGLVGVVGIVLSHAQTSPSNQAAVTPSMRRAAGQILLTYKSGADLTQLANDFTSLGATEANSIPESHLKVLNVRADQRDSVINALQANPLVVAVEPNRAGKRSDAKPSANSNNLKAKNFRTMLQRGRRVADSTLIQEPGDPEYLYQDYTHSTNIDLMWGKAKGTAQTVVAVLDSGVDSTNPDLQGKLVAGTNVYSDNSDTKDDELYVGTTASLTIAAQTDNDVGGTGTCWNCKIMPLKMFGPDGDYTDDVIIKGIDYAVAHKATVVNISATESGLSCSTAMESAISQAASKGVAVVTAAGDDGTNAESDLGCNSAINVADLAYNDYDSLAPDSNYSSNVDIAAPGSIFSLDPDSSTKEFAWWGDNTAWATALVSGVYASLKAAFPSASVSTVREAMLKSADPCCGGKIGTAGSLNAMRAYRYLEGNGTVADTVKPTISGPYPADGARAGGRSPLAVEHADDNAAIAKVTFWDHESNIVDDYATSEPYAITWNTASDPDGTVRQWRAVATDTSGNTAFVDWSVTVDQTATTTPPPTTPPPTTPPPTTPPPTTPPPTTPPPTTPPKTGDVNGDGKVNITDLSKLLAAWGSSNADADVNKSGKVDITDLSQLLGHWGS